MDSWNRTITSLWRYDLDCVFCFHIFCLLPILKTFAARRPPPPPPPLWIKAALDAGFRALFLDSCACSVIGTALCHNVCAAGYRTIPLVFNAIMEFMKRNPNEVVIIEIQIGGNTLSSLFEQVFQIPGFSDMMYKHPGPEYEWPLMKDLIANNTVSEHVRMAYS